MEVNYYINISLRFIYWISLFEWKFIGGPGFYGKDLLQISKFLDNSIILFLFLGGGRPGFYGGKLK
jgi:hypothetical protein